MEGGGAAKGGGVHVKLIRELSWQIVLIIAEMRRFTDMDLEEETRRVAMEGEMRECSAGCGKVAANAGASGGRRQESCALYQRVVFRFSVMLIAGTL